MPRSNRYILPGYVYHLTHRCHNRRFLLKFGCDRNEYRERLRQALHEFDIPLFAYCITSNHTHLLASCRQNGDISRMMQKLEGDFAQSYNERRRRRGAFWEDRFHCTMIEEGPHFLNCLIYIHLNMVRAQVVRSPGEWRWCGHDELVGARSRYRLIDRDALHEVLGPALQDEFEGAYRDGVETAIKKGQLRREPWWTESIAVGREAFVRSIEEQTIHRHRLETREAGEGVWVVRESEATYEAANEP